MEKRILVLGSIFTEFVMHVDKVPLANEVTEEYGARETVAGGAGLNVAAAFSRLGADTVLCTRVGADAQGAALIRAINNFGIDSRFVYEDEKGKSGFRAVIVESSGVTRTASYPGIAYDITEADAEEALTCYPDALFTSLELSPKTIVAAAELCHEADVPVFLEASPADTRFPFSRLPRLEAFICNAEEAAAYTKITPDTLENCLRVALKLSSMVEAKHYIIKLGARGCYTYDGTYQNIYPTITTPVVDMRGAGDVFCAATTLGYLEGGDIEAALKYANIASAVTITRQGRCASYPTNEDIEEFIDNNDVN